MLVGGGGAGARSSPDAGLALQKRLGLSDPDLAALQALPLFAGLDPCGFSILLADAVVRRFPRGTTLFLQDDPADRFYVVLDGWVRLIRYTPDGSEMTIALFGRGESFAEAALLEEGRYPVTGQVIEPSRLLVVPGDGFLARLRESTELCFNMMASLSRRLYVFLQQIEQISTHSSLERVALFLLRLAHRDAGACRVELPHDKTFIAARLGMQPETLSRAFAKLRRHGVEVNGGTVSIADLARLRAVAEGRG